MDEWWVGGRVGGSEGTVVAVDLSGSVCGAFCRFSPVVSVMLFISLSAVALGCQR